jgi:hypothetical protein
MSQYATPRRMPQTKKLTHFFMDQCKNFMLECEPFLYSPDVDMHSFNSRMSQKYTEFLKQCNLTLWRGMIDRHAFHRRDLDSVWCILWYNRYNTVLGILQSIICVTNWPCNFSTHRAKKSL